jgi:hypothetical protein
MALQGFLHLRTSMLQLLQRTEHDSLLIRYVAYVAGA